MAYWIVVGSEENLRIAAARGFDIFGFKSTRRAEVSRMKAGDRLIFYLTKIMKFGGIAEVTSEYFEDHTKVFKSTKKPSEDYPFRVNVRPIVVLSADQYLDVREIAPALEFTKKWPQEHWRLAFQGNLHEIPESDYVRIRGADAAGCGAVGESRPGLSNSLTPAAPLPPSSSPYGRTPGQPNARQRKDAAA